MAAGALVLFGMIGYRLPGQIRARRRELAARRPTPSREPAEPAATEPDRRPTPDPGPPRRTRVSDQRILASSAVMAAGTVFSRGLRASSAARCWSRRSAASCAPTSSRSPTRCPTWSTSCWRAASSTPCSCPQLVRAHQGRPRRRRRLRQPGHHRSSALFLGAVTVLLVVLAPLLLRVYLDDRFLDPDRVAAARDDRRPDPVVPAAGLLLRDVRPGRADPQRARPLRPDDVGADRQQPDRGRDARHLPRGLGPDRRRARALRGAAAPARRCCSASARRSGSSPSAWSCVPYLRALGLHLPPALRLPRPRAAAHAVASASGRCCS